MNSAIIADDSKPIRAVMKKILAKQGFEVLAEVENGKEAIEKVGELTPSLLLLDINMPIMTGTEALPEILDISPETIVIMLSSVSDKAIVANALNEGASNYIVKGSDWEEIGRSIAETWENNQF